MLKALILVAVAAGNYGVVKAKGVGEVPVPAPGTQAKALKKAADLAHRDSIANLAKQWVPEAEQCAETMPPSRVSEIMKEIADISNGSTEQVFKVSVEAGLSEEALVAALIECGRKKNPQKIQLLVALRMKGPGMPSKRAPTLNPAEHIAMRRLEFHGFPSKDVSSEIVAKTRNMKGLARLHARKLGASHLLAGTVMLEDNGSIDSKESARAQVHLRAATANPSSTFAVAADSDSTRTFAPTLPEAMSDAMTHAVTRATDLILLRLLFQE